MRFLSDYSEMSSLAVLRSLIRDPELAGKKPHFSLPLCRFCACCVRGRRLIFSQDSCNLRQQRCKPLTSSEPDGRVYAVVLLAPCALQIRHRDEADRRSAACVTHELKPLVTTMCGQLADLLRATLTCFHTSQEVKALPLWRLTRRLIVRLMIWTRLLQFARFNTGSCTNKMRWTKPCIKPQLILGVDMFVTYPRYNKWVQHLLWWQEWKIINHNLCTC